MQNNERIFQLDDNELKDLWNDVRKKEREGKESEPFLQYLRDHNLITSDIDMDDLRKQEIQRARQELMLECCRRVTVSELTSDV